MLGNIALIPRFGGPWPLPKTAGELHRLVSRGLLLPSLRRQSRLSIQSSFYDILDMRISDPYWVSWGPLVMDAGVR